MTAPEFLDALRSYCSRFEASVTSYGRTAIHNDAVGGVPTSAHQFWLGADVIYDTHVPEPARREIARRLGLALVIEGDHDHLQPWDWLPHS